MSQPLGPAERADFIEIRRNTNQPTLEEALNSGLQTAVVLDEELVRSLIEDKDNRCHRILESAQYSLKQGSIRDEVTIHFMFFGVHSLKSWCSGMRCALKWLI